MKFGIYLEDAQIPEWKKIYIDYKGLKRLIASIRLEREENRPRRPFSFRSSVRSPLSTFSTAPWGQKPASAPIIEDPRSVATLSIQPKRRQPSVTMKLPEKPSRETISRPSPTPNRWFRHDMPEQLSMATGNDAASAKTRMLQRLSFMSLRSRGTYQETNNPVFENYDDFLESITPLELKFFDYLDDQIKKAEDFYNERYKEAARRMEALKEQFKELRDHRKAYRAAHSEEAIARQKDRHLLPPFRMNPETYHEAKKDLKRAAIEFHRFLEFMKDFQALNLTAIRKSIKKFEKSTGMRVRELHNAERVDHLSISSDKDVKLLLDRIERMYASRFESGDIKKARSRLRVDPNQRMHHLSTFMSGLMTGFGMLGVVVGTYAVLRPARQEQLPIWWALLEVFSVFGIPTIFSLLVGINMAVWVQRRLNHVFIFELDVRTAVDYRVYFETPAFLFFTLSCCYVLSLTGIFEPHISAQVWPLVWVVLLMVVFLDPWPILHLSSRLWLLKNWAKLLLSGFIPVEFADFWMGDQFSSMTYSLGHLCFVGCAYAHQWDSLESTCNMQSNAAQGIILPSIPSLIRLIQCLKRYFDSKNYIQLINAGKYAVSILASGVFFNWKAQGSKHDGSYALYIFFNIVSTIYSTSWDLLMDWSLFNRKASHPLLRPELIYGDIYPVYYFAIVANILLRFSWIVNAALGPLNSNTRSAIVALLEAFRRFQWNFFRVENEHIGNADQYRVTREVPLPYSLSREEPQDESDDDEK